MGQCVPLIYAMSVLLMIGFYEVPGACQRILSRCDWHRKEVTAQKTPQDLKATGMSLPAFAAGVYSEYLKGEYTWVIKWNRQISGGSRIRSVTCPYKFTIDEQSLNRKGQFSTGIITVPEIFAGSQSGKEIFGAVKSPEAAKDHSTDRKSDGNRGSESHKPIWDRVVGRGDRLEWNRMRQAAEERGTGWKKEIHEGVSSEGSETGLQIAAMEPCVYVDLPVAIMTTALFVALVLAIFTSCWIRRNRHVMDAAAGDGPNKMGNCWSEEKPKYSKSTDDVQGNSPNNREKVHKEPAPTHQMNEDQPLTLQVEKRSTTKVKPRKNGPQDAATLHRVFLRNWSKNLKYVHAGGGQTAGKRSFADLYTDLRITGATTEGVPLGNDGGNDEDVEPHQLLKRNNAEKEETSTIMVHGVAGSGKSTLIQKIIHDWANKRIYKEFKYIFSFKFQNLNAIKYVTNLNTLCLETYPHLVTCLEDLWKDPKNILFILDDMDECLQNYLADDDGNGGQPGECMYPDYNGYVRDILTYLIQGRLVKGCFLLVTTRPLRLEAVQEIPVTSTYHLTGFTPEKVKEYFECSFGDKKNAEQLVQRVEACETLGSLYVNPLFCSIVASLPEWSQVGEHPILTMGHTRVLSEYLTTIMGLCGFDKQTSRQSLLHLGEAAYKKIRDQSFLFEAQSLSELNRCLSTFTSGLMMETPGKGERDVVYKFNYPILQNFVAALVKSRNPPGISLKMLLNEAYTVTDDRFNIFSRFLVGLSSRGSTKWLERVLGSISPEALSSIADWIKESVKTRHSNLDGKTTQGKFLNILHCLFEFGDPQLATEALDPMRTIKFNQCSLDTFDCVVLSSTLICCRPIEELDLSSCGVKQKGIRYLQPVLCKCKVLRLKSNQLADDCIESLISVVQTNRSLTLLDLSNCDEDKQKMNEFTAEKLQTFVQDCRQEREVRWAHHEDIEQKDSKLDKASNILTIITE